jgi:hypothetical protein
MKELYTTPAIQVEELAKADVLCGSFEEDLFNDFHSVISDGGIASVDDLLG